MTEPASNSRSTTPRPAPNGKPAPLVPFFDRRRLTLLRVKATRGPLSGMRIRKKLLVLHTLFSLLLAGLLVLALRVALSDVILAAEMDQSRVLLDNVRRVVASSGGEENLPAIVADLAPSALVLVGTSSELDLPPTVAVEAIGAGGRAVTTETSRLGPAAALYIPAAGGQTDRFYLLAATVPGVRDAVRTLYLIVVLALLAVYALVALALEVFVLPQSVYRPIRRTLDADQAVQEGRTDDELIPEPEIPADELGEIMRSRNESILKLRAQGAALSGALAQLESVATDLKRKNHLLEAARRNLADADRLASLGMMSAGIAHELNTPLAVLKGLVERLNENPRAGMDPAQAALMARVVGRLERLGESLLDFARVRPPQYRSAALRTLVQEAATLVRLDREAGDVEISNRVSEVLTAECDADRLVQVFVNLLRNAVDAVRSRATPSSPRGTVDIEASRTLRDGRAWIILTITDDGPGIDAAILPRLFEPFASTRLDARGTGLGLAVAEGIIKEHGGVLLARNRADRSGAIFEIMLPETAPVIDRPSQEPIP